MSRRLRLAFLAAGAALLVLLVAHVGPRTLLDDLRRAGWSLVPILLVWAVVYAMNTAAWLLLVAPADGPPAAPRGIPFPRAYAITVSSFALNYVTPFIALGGEAFRARAAATWLGGRRAAASVVAFRVVHTAGQFIFWLLSVPLAFALFPPTAAVRALLSAVALLLLTGTVLLGATLRARTLERLLDVLPRIPLLGALAAPLERRRPALLALDAELAALAHERPRRLVLSLAIETAARCVAILEFLLIGRAIGERVSYGASIVIGGFSQLVMNALFFVPFEIGAREGSLFAVFRLLGHAPHVAMYGAVVSRLREVTWIVIGLGLLWLGSGAPVVDGRTQAAD